MSRIEQLISEIEDYIDHCKYQPLSKNVNIIVNKEELEELLVELRLRIPDEIKKYQKIISNKEAILQEAKTQADSILANATAQTNNMVNEHEIMQQAYEQANAIVGEANAQAQAIVDDAMNMANDIRFGAVQYTDDMLGSLQNIIDYTLNNAQERFGSFMASMQQSYDIVSANRQELAPGVEAEEEAAVTEDMPE